MPPRAFVWATHHVSSARWLKAELASAAPNLHFAFSRPGLTTFRVDREGAFPPLLLRASPQNSSLHASRRADLGAGSRAMASPELRLPSSFARAFGLSLGRADTAANVLEALAPYRKAPLRLHVFERDIDVPVDEQDASVHGRRAAAVEAELRAAAPEAFLPEAYARSGELVADVIVPHSTQPDEPLLVGVHRHDIHHGPWPGGVSHVPPPEDAPSRAYCKLEEALRWADLTPAPGEIAVELGSSPGGATLSLLRRGLHVYGVDPGEMHPITKAFNGAQGPHKNRFGPPPYAGGRGAQAGAAAQVPVAAPRHQPGADGGAALRRALRRAGARRAARRGAHDQAQRRRRVRGAAAAARARRQARPQACCG